MKLTLIARYTDRAAVGMKIDPKDDAFQLTLWSADENDTLIEPLKKEPFTLQEHEVVRLIVTLTKLDEIAAMTLLLAQRLEAEEESSKEVGK